jgi:hypothetical protein
VMAAAGLMVVPNGDFLCEKLCAWDKSKGDCTRRRARIAPRKSAEAPGIAEAPRFAEAPGIAEAPRFAEAPQFRTSVRLYVIGNTSAARSLE